MEQMGSKNGKVLEMRAEWESETRSGSFKDYFTNSLGFVLNVMGRDWNENFEHTHDMMCFTYCEDHLLVCSQECGSL